MASTDEYLARYATALQPHVPEPIRAVGILCRPGALGNALVYQASPMVAMIRNRSAKKASGGLPPTWRWRPPRPASTSSTIGPPTAG